MSEAADQRHRTALSNIAYYLEAGRHGFEPDLTRARSYAVTLLETLDADKSGRNDRDRRIAEERLANLDTLVENERIWEDGLADLEKRAAQGEAEARAYAWMQDAAERGHRGAMIYMGRVYMRGMEKHRIAKDLTIAKSFLEGSLEGLRGDIVYQRKSGSMTVMTTRDEVERALASITDLVRDGDRYTCVLPSIPRR